MENVKKCAAEIFGTAVLLFFGVGSAIFLGAQYGHVGIALAFGIAIIAAAYGIGHISGAHLNPAVSLGAFLAGRMKAMEMLMYMIAQIIGAFIGTFLVFIMLTQMVPEYKVADYGLGENKVFTSQTTETKEQGAYVAAIVFETAATFLFVTVILGATSKKNPNVANAGLAIGLTLAAIHIVGIPITGVSVNPARSIAPAIFVGGTALKELWIFIVAPLFGGALAGLVNRLGTKKEA